MYIWDIVRQVLSVLPARCVWAKHSGFDISTKAQDFGLACIPSRISLTKDQLQ